MQFCPWGCSAQQQSLATQRPSTSRRQLLQSVSRFSPLVLSPGAACMHTEVPSFSCWLTWPLSRGAKRRRLQRRVGRPFFLSGPRRDLTPRHAALVCRQPLPEGLKRGVESPRNSEIPRAAEFHLELPQSVIECGFLGRCGGQEPYCDCRVGDDLSPNFIQSGRCSLLHPCDRCIRPPC